MKKVVVGGKMRAVYTAKEAAIMLKDEDLSPDDILAFRRRGWIQAVPISRSKSRGVVRWAFTLTEIMKIHRLRQQQDPSHEV